MIRIRAYRIGQAAVDKGKVLDGVGKRLGKGLPFVSFGIDTVDDIVNSHRPVGQAVIYNGMATGLGYAAGVGGAAIATAFAAPGILVVGASVVAAAGATAFFELLYKDNVLHLKDGINGIGKGFDWGFNALRGTLEASPKSVGYVFSV